MAAVWLLDSLADWNVKRRAERAGQQVELELPPVRNLFTQDPPHWSAILLQSLLAFATPTTADLEARREDQERQCGLSRKSKAPDTTVCVRALRLAPERTLRDVLSWLVDFQGTGASIPEPDAPPEAFMHLCGAEGAELCTGILGQIRVTQAGLAWASSRWRSTMAASRESSG